MTAKSIAALAAAVATFGLVALNAQAAPSLTVADIAASAETSLTKVVYEVCQGNGLESYCQVLGDEKPDPLESLIMGGDDDDDE